MKTPAKPLVLAALAGAVLVAPRTPDLRAEDTPPAIIAFEHFIRSSGDICEKRPSTVCVDKGIGFADRDRDGGIGIEELKTLRSELLNWTQWRGESLAGAERFGIATGVWLIDSVGLESLFASYNRDGDGKLSKAELLTDVKLDQRPLGAVLTDPEAVDRSALAARLGKFAPLLGPLLGPAN